MATAAHDIPSGKRTRVTPRSRKEGQPQAEDHLVAMLLGGKGSDDRMDIYHAVLEGFTLRTVLIMVESSGVYRQSGALAKIMGTSDRTLARRLQAPDQTLTPEQSTRALHYAEIMERATDVLGNRRLAEQWMTKPAPGLDGEVPLNLIANAVGYELVSELLTRMDYGVY